MKRAEEIEKQIKKSQRQTHEPYQTSLRKYTEDHRHASELTGKHEMLS